jgi:predicted transposase YbfD/YdcC
MLLWCQKEIVKQIREGGGDYVITLKKNQSGLYQRVEALFKEALSKQYQEFVFSSHRRSEQRHSREETRYCVQVE